MGEGNTGRAATALAELLGLPLRIHEGERVVKLRRFTVHAAIGAVVVDAEYQVIIGASAEIGGRDSRRFECKEIPRAALAGIADSVDTLQRARGLV